MTNSRREQLLYCMLRVRRVEEAIADRYSEQEMRCPTHLCIGQEAIAAGVCTALDRDDRVFSGHRAHGHYLAKGGGLVPMIAELYGRKNGCCGGRGGSMHLIDLKAGFVGATPIVGGTVPLAVGTAWASALQGKRNVTVVFFGDGCFEEGVMHESMNFAALHKLPVVFVCENNNFSVYTPLSLRQPSRPIFQIAAAHGLDARHGDGNDVDQVYKIASQAIDDARNGHGAQFLELTTYRWREHCGPNFDDDLKYRSEYEIEQGIKSCPIERYRAIIAESGVDTSSLFERLEAEVQSEIEAAFAAALAGPYPTPQEAGSKVYA